MVGFYFYFFLCFGGGMYGRKEIDWSLFERRPGWGLNKVGWAVWDIFVELNFWVSLHLFSLK